MPFQRPEIEPQIVFDSKIQNRNIVFNVIHDTTKRDKRICKGSARKFERMLRYIKSAIICPTQLIDPRNVKRFLALHENAHEIPAEIDNEVALRGSPSPSIRLFPFNSAKFRPVIFRQLLSFHRSSTSPPTGSFFFYSSTSLILRLHGSLNHFTRCFYMIFLPSQSLPAKSGQRRLALLPFSVHCSTPFSPSLPSSRVTTPLVSALLISFLPHLPPAISSIPLSHLVFIAATSTSIISFASLA